MFLSISTRWMLFSVILALSREGKVSRHNFHLEMSHPGWAERDLIWQLLQGKVPTICPPLILDGARHPIQQVLFPQAAQVWRPVLRVWGPGRWPLLVVCRDRDGGEVHHFPRPGPRLLEGLSQGSWTLKDVLPSLLTGTNRSPTGPRLGDLQALQKMPESASSVTFQVMNTTPPYLNHFPNIPLLTLTGVQGPVWCWSIAEQDNEWSLTDSWLLVNGAIWSTKQGWATPVA